MQSAVWESCSGRRCDVQQKGKGNGVPRMASHGQAGGGPSPGRRSGNPVRCAALRPPQGGFKGHPVYTANGVALLLRCAGGVVGAWLAGRQGRSSAPARRHAVAHRRPTRPPCCATHCLPCSWMVARVLLFLRFFSHVAAHLHEFPLVRACCFCTI